ncbi:hypothetical protein J6590_044720 [Homalodisca vitripennis]|nr:hypothetical protein J6590_044720 [Homalodisca vitripennis]
MESKDIPIAWYSVLRANKINKDRQVVLVQGMSRDNIAIVIFRLLSASRSGEWCRGCHCFHRAKEQFRARARSGLMRDGVVA